mmetsp:Transcript_12986/g.39145  ORF Transcript_12986/g.39145 Transcript_12986/m.39145 type:complete len:129 (-) Transcript_12986:25-411(-)
MEAQHAEAAGVGTEEHVKLVMRAEQAERRATATEAELADNARRYAREIAALKLKLAEKEAELMGGFGSQVNLELDELPQPNPRDPPAMGRPAQPVHPSGSLRRSSNSKLESLVPRTPPGPTPISAQPS